MNTLDISPMPNHRMAMDTQAMGGMGLNRSNRGFTIALTYLFRAMNRPRGTATTLAAMKADEHALGAGPDVAILRFVPANFMYVRQYS